MLQKTFLGKRLWKSGKDFFYLILLYEPSESGSDPKLLAGIVDMSDKLLPRSGVPLYCSHGNSLLSSWLNCEDVAHFLGSS